MAEYKENFSIQNIGYWMKTSFGSLLIFAFAFGILKFLSCQYLITLGLLLLAKKLSSFIMITIRKFAPKKRIINPGYKAVFVTGCDSGFGHNAAKLLDKAGYWVYAGCLQPLDSGAENLKNECSSRLRIVHLDVSNADMISNALQFVKDTLNGKDLWAVVNNAGISHYSRLDWSTIDTYRRIHEVNAFGPVQVSIAFLPLLRKSKGRVVNVISGLGACTWPGVVPYCMSKHAVLSFTEGLQQELQQFNVTAHAILPSLYRTAISDCNVRSRDIDNSWAQISEETRNSYGENYAEQMKKSLLTSQNIGSTNVMEVCTEIYNAVSDIQPQDKYIPGFITEIMFHVYISLPMKIRNYIACVKLPRIRS